MSDDFVFTSESVTVGHPDKLCDQVSDAIVDYFLRHDPHSSIVAECAIASGIMFVSAHYASKAGLAIPEVAREVVRGVGYTKDVFDAARQKDAFAGEGALSMSTGSRHGEILSDRSRMSSPPRRRAGSRPGGDRFRRLPCWPDPVWRIAAPPDPRRGPWRRS